MTCSRYVSSVLNVLESGCVSFHGQRGGLLLKVQDGGELPAAIECENAIKPTRNVGWMVIGGKSRPK